MLNVMGLALKSHHMDGQQKCGSEWIEMHTKFAGSNAGFNRYLTLHLKMA